jgi:hypothetical protein
MNRIHIAITVALLCPASYAVAGVSGEQMRDQIIETVVHDNWNNKETCRRVAELGKGTVSSDMCSLRVDPANTRCIAFAKKRVPVVLEKEQAEFLVEILMTCPIADVLGIGYSIDGRQIHIQWNELNR